MKKRAETMLEARGEVGLDVERKLFVWLCLVTRMQDKIIIYCLLIHPSRI
jgi:hypothetical protein